MTCKITAGNIYKIPFPFIDLTESKIRPALAITDGDAQFTTTPLRVLGSDPFFLFFICSGRLVRTVSVY